MTLLILFGQLILLDLAAWVSDHDSRRAGDWTSRAER